MDPEYSYPSKSELPYVLIELSISNDSYIFHSDDLLEKIEQSHKDFFDDYGIKLFHQPPRGLGAGGGTFYAVVLEWIKNHHAMLVTLKSMPALIRIGKFGFDIWRKVSHWRAAKSYEKSKRKGVIVVAELSFYVKNDPSLFNPQNYPLVAALREFSNIYPSLEKALQEKYPGIWMYHVVKIRPTDERSGIIVGGFKNEPLVMKRILKSALKNLSKHSTIAYGFRRKPVLLYKTYSIDRNALML